MHRKLQQVKDLVEENIDTILVAAYLFFLPFYIGEIVYAESARLFGIYFNYLHVRVTLHTLLSIFITARWLKTLEARKRNILLRSASIVLALLILSWFYPTFRLSLQAELPFLQLFAVSIIRLLATALGWISLIYVTSRVLRDIQHARVYIGSIVASLLIQVSLGFLQLTLGGPLFPAALSWTGQPLMFTSDSIIGIARYARVYGTTPHPNILAAIAGYFSFLSFSFLETKKLRISPLVALILAGILILGTMSKVGLIAFLVISFIYTRRTYINHLSTGKKLLTAATIFMIILPVTLVLVCYFFHIPISSLFYRGEIILNYVRLLTRLPWLLFTGTGYGLSAPTLLANASFSSVFPFLGNGLSVEMIHNVFLLFIVEFGIIPVLVMVFLLLRTKWRWPPASIGLNQWQILSVIILLFLFGGFDHLLL